MEQTQIILHPDYTIAPVDPRIFGGFLEHLGRAVYQGVYQPDSIHADEDGFRQDVLAALRDMRLTTLRYPGGNADTRKPSACTIATAFGCCVDVQVIISGS